MTKQIFLILFALLFYHNESCAWNAENTHKELSEKAAVFSVLNSTNGDYLKNLGFHNNLEEAFIFNGESKTAKDWIGKIGGVLEDEGSSLTGRFYNHFHNPIYTYTQWGSAGLTSGWPWVHSGKSAVLWAVDDSSNDWRWARVRDCYYKALTLSADAERQANFALTFRGLGQIIHLIQDMAQPAHVRNDPHPLDDKGRAPGFEFWAKRPDNKYLVASLMAKPIYPDVALDSIVGGYSPITQFFDTDQYNGTNPSSSPSLGLAEYTNANFVSEDTIFSDFAYPRREDTVIFAENQNKTWNGFEVYRKYFEKVSGGQPIKHFTTASRLYAYLLDDPSPALFGFDSRCYTDYADHLIPRAVGYSAALINYFFRGQMETSALEKIDDNGDVTELVVNVKNTTPNETMKDGYFTLSFRYKRQWVNQYFYGTSAALPSGELAPDASPVAFTFAFADPIPVDATGKQYILVFHDGTLGAETGAVVGKVVDVTPAEIDITFPERFVYAIVDDGSTPPGVKEFKKLRARLRDNAPDIEMTGGSVTARAKYKLHLRHLDDLSTEPPYAEDRSYDFYTSTSQPVAVSLDEMNTSEIEFDFSANPIPFGVTDLALEVTYTQGDTVIAFGAKDLNEPQYIGVWNSRDRFLIDLDPNRDDDIHDWRLMTESEIVNDPALVAMLDTDNGGFIDEIIDAVATDVDVYFSATPPSAPPATYHATFGKIPAGRYGRVAIITDQPYLFALFHEQHTSSLPDTSAPGDYLKYEGKITYITPGVTNQSEDGTYYYTSIYSFRGAKNHFTYISVGVYPEPSNLTEKAIAIKEASWPAPASTTPVPAAAIQP